MTKRKSHTQRRGPFEISYCAREQDLAGKMEPKFRPFWQVQYLGDGTFQTFNSKREALEWIKDWETIEGIFSEYRDK